MVINDKYDRKLFARELRQNRTDEQISGHDKPAPRPISEEKQYKDVK